MIDKITVWALLWVPYTVGLIVLAVGGAWLGSSITTGIGRAIGQAWIKCSRKWRDILKAEETILEFRREREDYLAWKERQKDER